MKKVPTIGFDATTTIKRSDWGLNWNAAIEGGGEELENGDVLTYNPEEAKKLWAEADKMSPFSGSLDIAYNADGGHDAWVDAVSNSIKNTLGIEASGDPKPRKVAEALNAVAARIEKIAQSV